MCMCVRAHTLIYSITHVCLSILSSPLQPWRLGSVYLKQGVIERQMLWGLPRPHTWNVKKLSGRSFLLKNVPFCRGGRQEGTGTHPRGSPSASLLWLCTPHFDTRPPKLYGWCVQVCEMIWLVADEWNKVLPPPPHFHLDLHLSLSSRDPSFLMLCPADWQPPASALSSQVACWAGISVFSQWLYFWLPGEGHLSWYQGPSVLSAPTFQNIPVWCEVKLCKLPFKRKESKRKISVKMHLLDHIFKQSMTGGVGR